jgi:hypothetical protein
MFKFNLLNISICFFYLIVFSLFFLSCFTGVGWSSIFVTCIFSIPFLYIITNDKLVQHMGFIYFCMMLTEGVTDSFFDYPFMSDTSQFARGSKESIESSKKDSLIMEKVHEQRREKLKKYWDNLLN